MNWTDFELRQRAARIEPVSALGFD